MLENETYNAISTIISICSSNTEDNCEQCSFFSWSKCACFFSTSRDVPENWEFSQTRYIFD